MKKIYFLFAGLFLFYACNNEATTSEGVIEVEEEITEEAEDLSKYAEIGFEYAISTKGVLGKNLTGKLAEGGPLVALEFCNEQAIPLTDSMSVVHNANIKRVSDKNRNPNNFANAEELEYIQHFKDVVAAGKTGKEIEPIALAEGDNIRFYYPILTNEMCLQCHGVKNEVVSPETIAEIEKYYPEDLATGYGDNEVRGIWSILFER